MNSELKNFIKVWILAYTCVSYCYFVAVKIRKGFMRLISILPVFYLFIILPLNLHAFHLSMPTSFFLVWLGTFKLLLFSFDLGPLSPTPPTLFQFISISCLPIRIKQNPPTISPPNKNPSHQITKKPRKSVYPTRSILLAIKVLLFAMIIKSYKYRSHFHPYTILAMYCCHLYFCVEIVLFLSAIPARAIFGFELEPQFKEPQLSTSLQDFWGRRWNVMTSNILRLTIYHPVRRIFKPIIGSRWATCPAVISAFAVSGMMHEVLLYYYLRVSPTWEVTWFFLLHGFCVVIEVEVKKMVADRWRLPWIVSGPLTLLFIGATAGWLFFPQLMRNDGDLKVINEYSIMEDFIKGYLRALTTYF